jgi:thiol-disulfide isomerase/thioredoxin
MLRPGSALVSWKSLEHGILFLRSRNKKVSQSDSQKWKFFRVGKRTTLARLSGLNSSQNTRRRQRAMANQVVVLLAVVAAAVLIFMFANSLRKKRGPGKNAESSVAAAAKAPAAPPRQAGVQAATADNLEQLISSFPGQTLVLFYAPWCGYCKSAKPKFAQIATTADPNRYQFLTFDCDTAKALGSKYAASFPTIVKFRNQSLQPIDKVVGDRPLNDMTAFTQS